MKWFIDVRANVLCRKKVFSKKTLAMASKISLSSPHSSPKKTPYLEKKPSSIIRVTKKKKVFKTDSAQTHKRQHRRIFQKKTDKFDETPTSPRSYVKPKQDLRSHLTIARSR